MNRLHTTISLAKHSVRFSVMNDDIANPNSDQAVEAEIEVYPSADGGLTTASFCPDPVTAPPIVAEAIAKHSQSDVAIVCVDLMDNNQLNGITFGYAKRLIDAVKGNPVLVHLANLLRVEIVDFELNPYTGDIARGQIGDMRFQMVMNKDGISNVHRDIFNSESLDDVQKRLIVGFRLTTNPVTHS